MGIVFGVGIINMLRIAEVLQKLRNLDVNSLTPIQCMNTLFELCSMLK